MKYGIGYDHNFVIDGPAGELRLAATVHEPVSGRIMEVLTTEPGVQIYSGNFLSGKTQGKSGRPTVSFGTLFGDAAFPGQREPASFPSTILRPGETYRTATVYRFSAK